MDTQLNLRRSISEGLSAWLTFEEHCGRRNLFSERYLALPLAQILANNVNGVIEAEHNHPVLTSKGRPGRPAQLDFIVRANGRVTLAVESKWAGASGISVRDVIWDCVRLELAAHHYNCDALFVLAGQRDKVDNLLMSRPFNPDTSRGNPSRVLGLNNAGRSSVNIQSPKRDFGPALHKQLKLYKDISFPRSFVCGTGTQVPKSAPAASFTAAVWRIRPELPAKRHTFFA